MSDPKDPKEETKAKASDIFTDRVAKGVPPDPTMWPWYEALLSIIPKKNGICSTAVDNLAAIVRANLIGASFVFDGTRITTIKGLLLAFVESKTTALDAKTEGEREAALAIDERFNTVGTKIINDAWDTLSAEDKAEYVKAVKQFNFEEDATQTAQVTAELFTSIAKFLTVTNNNVELAHAMIDRAAKTLGAVFEFMDLVESAVNEVNAPAAAAAEPEPAAEPAAEPEAAAAAPADSPVGRTVSSAPWAADA